MIIRVVVNQTKIEERIEYLLEKLFSPSQSDFYEELIKWTIIKIVSMWHLPPEYNRVNL